VTTLRVKTDSFFLLDSAGWPALLVESGGTIRKANQAALALFGSKLESDSTVLSALWANQEESAEQFLGRLERAIPAVATLKLQTKGGTGTSFSTSICSLNWEVGKRYIFQLFPEQPREAVDAKSPLPESNGNGAHKQKLDCALQLTRTVALDFNNALTSIIGHASLVLSKMEPTHAWRHSLSEIEKAGQRAAEVAHQLAAFSRAEKEAPPSASGNLNALLRRVVEIFQRSSGPRITWSLDLESKLYSTKIDEAKVQQAFVKVLENAVEAMPPEGQVTVSSRNLDVSAVTHDGSVRLEPCSYVCAEISDTGAGIEPTVLPRVFEPFFTTKQGHRGLGLAWVYGIITNHGGGVTIASQARQGASVRLYLPANHKVVAERPPGAADLGGNHTILVVDDEELVLNMSRTILSSFGYTVLTASSGAKALEVFSAGNSSIDLLITDLVMPQMSGRELIEKVHSLSPGLPVISTSGFVRAGKDHSTAFLQKPFTSQDLLRRVKQLLTAAEAA